MLNKLAKEIYEINCSKGFTMTNQAAGKRCNSVRRQSESKCKAAFPL